MAQFSKDSFVLLLERELVPALGCTEPIALAFAAAKAREVLGEAPLAIRAACSGNIIKNVMGVVVPNSGGMKGIEAAVCLGAVGGVAEKELEVLAYITQEDIRRAQADVANKKCTVELLPDSEQLHIIISMQGAENTCLVELRYAHTNIIRIERNGQILLQNQLTDEDSHSQNGYEMLNLQSIYQFANEIELEKVIPILSEQIQCNTKISAEGLSQSYGCNVGKTLLEMHGKDVATRAKASAAAGSDARMSGCKLPVVINSGSGNQGITVSLPVIEYAKELSIDEQTLYRALCISNLVSIYIKHGIGVLSAFCGAVSAACGSGAAIAYLHGEPIDVIENTIINTLANVSGIVCDGAKPSCAAKIASSVDAAITSYHMAKAGRVFAPGDGIVKNTVDETIAAVAELGRFGMRETDLTILDIMIRNDVKK